MRPRLGYGEYLIDDIPPPNSTLYFYVEILKTKASFKPFAFDPQKLQSSASGLKYQILKEGKGERIREGMRIWMRYHFSKKAEKIYSTLLIPTS
jgi:FKBP-type peptidyl-prolyl cis-trans isomerase